MKIKNPTAMAKLNDLKPGEELKSGSIMSDAKRVKLGCERLLNSEMQLLTGKQIGIVTNHTGVLPNGEHIVDALRARSDVGIRALFSPEHGIRGDAPAGSHVGHEIDPKTGIQVFSLYGEHNKPEASMLEGIKTLVYDIQDVGVRFYTYISTLTLVMEAAAENGIELLLLDRPLVLSGGIIDGPVLENDVKSFVGMLPLPIVYSLTPGELAGLIRKEYLGKLASDLDMRVLKLENYSRSMWYDETGLDWLPPSPNISTIDTAAIYPGTALFEGTNINEGRGTASPFRFIGAPFIDKLKLADSLNSLGLPGVEFAPVDFIPREMSAVSHPRFLGTVCHGVEVAITDRNDLRPVEVGVAMLCAVKKLHRTEMTFRADGAFDKLIGNRDIRRMIEDGTEYNEIVSTWDSDLDRFRKSREEYFLY